MPKSPLVSVWGSQCGLSIESGEFLTDRTSGLSGAICGLPEHPGRDSHDSITDHNILWCPRENTPSACGGHHCSIDKADPDVASIYT